jgi:sugar phosphate permease
VTPRDQTLRESLDTHRWAVFGVIASVYFLVYFHRVSTSVIAPDLLAAFQANATALGFMSSMYFYIYALEQPLVGHLSDRLGPRRVVGLWSLSAALGCLLFGLAPSIGWAALGRAFIGFGVGGVYVPALKSFSQWFKKKEFATMTGLLLASGNLGAIVATTPLAWMAATWGWRSSFFVIGAVTLVLAFLTLYLIHDYASKESSGTDPLSLNPGNPPTSGLSARHVLTSIRFWILAAIFFGVFGDSISLQGLWATPFLMSLFQVERLHASWLNMLIPVGVILGAPLSGWLADRVFRDMANLLLTLLVIITAAWLVLTYGSPYLGLKGIIPLFLIIGGATGGMGTSLWATARETTPDAIIGLTTGLLNPFPLLGMAVLQGWTGAILDRTGKIEGMYPPRAFQDAFSLCLLVAVICLLLCVFFRKHLSTKSPSPEPAFSKRH